MRTIMRISIFGVFVITAAATFALLTLHPSATWRDTTYALDAQPTPPISVTCDSPWERLTASPASLNRLDQAAAFPGDPCAVVVTSRQNLASVTVVLAGALAAGLAVSLLPRPARFARRRRARDSGGLFRS